MVKPFREFKKTPKIALYLDMDGVFCNFEERIRKIFPDFEKMNGLYHDEMKDPEHHLLYERMVSAILNDPKFWENLDWMPGGEKLHSFILANQEYLNVAIMTAPISDDSRCCGQKQNWIKRNFKFKPKMFFCADDKWNYVGKIKGKYQVLIDDRVKNINKWNQHRGIGILHHHGSVDQTIKELQELINK